MPNLEPLAAARRPTARLTFWPSSWKLRAPGLTADAMAGVM
eukprot:CAMPEP_0180186274 /NCGR_PEP_ID=MMETSP0986-20121125/42881_1 /TAXON_ID=697907 /ORGANISM="non described non described, Strain CCMP2293" /LENGTH=40 /DNA_ID= /DNA_START= /DNA_END= /DNA_ORIENTATION=